MANSISIQTSIQSVVDGFRLSGTANSNGATTSSNAIGETINVYGNAWTAVSLGALTDVTALWAFNDNTTISQSVIQLSGSGGGMPIGTILPLGASTLLSWSGSISGLWAKAVSGATTTASLQFIAQQS